tara:strand:+ start:874 stop:1188 length:315 start_codon:yes stop_codon:yes gene_type:complete
MKMSDVETPEVETAENPLHDLVQAALDKDYNKANEIFGQVVSIKLDDIIDQERVKLAGQVYNGEEPEDDLEDDPEDFEIDDETEFDDELEDDELDEEEEEYSSN